MKGEDMKITHKGWNLQDDGSYNSGSTEDIMTPQNIKTGNIYIDFQSEWSDVRGYI